MPKKKNSKKMDDLAPKGRAKKVKGGINVWQDEKKNVPLHRAVDRLVVKPLQGSGKTIQKLTQP